MKIGVESSQVKFVPETEQEKQDLNALWQIVIRCDTDSKVLCPVGSYVPDQDETASFVVQDQ